MRTTKYKRLLEMCIVQHVEMKSVFTFQPIKYLDSTTVKCANPAATFRILSSRTKNRQFSCFGAMAHITHEMRDEVPSSVGAQGMDTSWYQVSDLDDVEFFWENAQLDVNAVLRPGKDASFSSTAFGDLEMGVSAENPILLDEE